MNLDTIAELSAKQIAAINTYLDEMNRQVFTEKQINFLADVDANDPLNLADECACIRGYFADLSDSELIGKTAHGVAADEDNQLAGAAYGVILVTCQNPNADVLLLNAEFEPLFIDYVRF